MDAVHKGGDKHILPCAHHYRTRKLFHYPRSPLCSFDSSNLRNQCLVLPFRNVASCSVESLKTVPLPCLYAGSRPFRA